MAGHNKWSKIRHKKGANDAKKALVLGKASKSLTLVSKECKGDRSDLRLQAAINHAKSVQLPRNRIEEAIEKGLVSKGAAGGGDEFASLRFDAMMRLENNTNKDSNESSGSNSSVQVACIITALSDNRNRTTQNVRHLVTKFGGEFLPTNHLNFVFENVGQIAVETTEHKADAIGLLDFEEELMERALEAGAINVEPVNDDEEEDEGEKDAGIAKENDSNSNKQFVVTTEEKDLWGVVLALRPEGENGDDSAAAAGDPSVDYKILRSEHCYILREDYGVGTADVANILSESEAAERFGNFLDRLDEDEDVHRVYHNALLM